MGTIILQHLLSIPGFQDIYDLYQSLFVGQLEINAVQTITLYLLVVSGLALAFFGYKMARFWAGVIGFVVGYLLTVIVIHGIPTVQGDLVYILSSITGIIVACLFVVFYKASVFICTFILPVMVAYMMLSPNVTYILIIIAVISLALAVLSLKFSAPIVMAVTSISGGLIAGLWFCYILNFVGITRMAIVAALTLIGGLVQFLMHNGKMKRKQKRKAEEIKSEQSTETHIEDARSFLDEQSDAE